MLARDYCDAAGRKKGKPIIRAPHALRPQGRPGEDVQVSRLGHLHGGLDADVRRKIRGASRARPRGRRARRGDAARGRPEEPVPRLRAARGLRRPARRSRPAARRSRAPTPCAAASRAPCRRRTSRTASRTPSTRSRPCARTLSATRAPPRSSRVRAYKAGPTPAPAWAAPAQASRRRALAAAADVAVGDAARVVVAFAPAPRLQCPLADAARHARGPPPRASRRRARGVIYCSDWAALAVDAAGADAKAIAACHRRYVRAVRALADLSRPAAARVGAVAQSAVALGRRLRIDVIAAGRAPASPARSAPPGRAPTTGARVGAVVRAHAAPTSRRRRGRRRRRQRRRRRSPSRGVRAEDDRGGAAAYAPPRVAAAAPPPLTLDAAAAAAGGERRVLGRRRARRCQAQAERAASREPPRARRSPSAPRSSRRPRRRARRRPRARERRRRPAAGDLDRLVADVARAPPRATSSRPSRGAREGVSPPRRPPPTTPTRKKTPHAIRHAAAAGRGVRSRATDAPLSWVNITPVLD